MRYPSLLETQNTGCEMLVWRTAAINIHGYMETTLLITSVTLMTKSWVSMVSSWHMIVVDVNVVVVVVDVVVVVIFE